MVVSYLGSPEMKGIYGLHPAFEKAFAEAERLIAADAGVGTYVVEEGSLWLSISEYNTKPVCESLYETHRDFIDIQLMVKGKERIGFADTKELTVTKPYVPDAEMYAMTDLRDDIIITPNKFVVIFPGEAHAPCMIAGDASEKIRKIVVKIKA